MTLYFCPRCDLGVWYGITHQCPPVVNSTTTTLTLGSRTTDDDDDGPDEEGIRIAKAIGWEVGYQRGVLDSEGDLERADNPYVDPLRAGGAS